MTNMLNENEKKNLVILVSAGAKILSEGKSIQEDIEIKTEAVRLLKLLTEEPEECSQM